MSDINPDSIYREFVTRGEAWSEARGAADLLEGTLKILKAQLTVEAKRAEGCSMAEAECIALSSSKYRDALSEAVRARTAANTANVRWVATQSLFEARRSAEASHRAAMKAAP